MTVDRPISQNYLERSHLLGSVQDGKAHIICTFKAWNVKQNVYMSKKNFIQHKTDDNNVFISEDLTKRRQFIVQQLKSARKDENIDSLYSVDSRIFRKENSTKAHKCVKKLMRSLQDTEQLVPDLQSETDESPVDILPAEQFCQH